MAKKTTQRRWMMAPSQKTKTPKSSLSESLKVDLDVKAKKLVQDVLKPRYVAPPAEDAQFNYITDVWVKWIGDTLYFGATYACPGPTAISPSFESRFARMEHVGGGRFTLSYMRHNDRWFRLPGDWTADESLKSIENDGHFRVG
jgi:hypothetical protein